MDPIKIYQACELGNVDAIKDFISDNKDNLNDKVSVSMMSLFALKGGSLNVIEHLYTTLPNSKELHDKHHVKLLIQASCFQNQPEIFKYVINKFPNDDVLEPALENCISHNNSKAIGYLFEKFSGSKKLEEKLASVIRDASTKGKLEILKYIFTDENIGNKAKNYLKDDVILGVAYYNNHINVVNYFIFDLNIELTPKIKKFIKTIPDLKRMFDSRDNYQSLTEELSNDSNNVTKKLKL